MNTASAWRFEFARRVASSYARHGAVGTVVVTGSTARGHADRYSDLELLVTWQADPTEEERARAIRALGGDLHRLYPFDDGLWEDTFFMGRDAAGTAKSGLLVEIVHLRHERVEQILDDVLSSFDLDDGKQQLVAALRHGAVLHGEASGRAWQARAAEFPPELARRLVRRFAPIDHFWRWEMFVARGNPFALRAHFAGVQERLVRLLLAVNGRFFHGLKWIDVVLDELVTAPPRFAERWKSVDVLPPEQAAGVLAALVDDVYDVVQRAVPGIDASEVEWWRHIFHYVRPRWSERPPLDGPIELQGDS